MSKIKIIKPSKDAMPMKIKRYIMPITVVYETVKPTLSSMDVPYAHIIE